MANNEAITYEIDQLIAMNRDEDEEVELKHHPGKPQTGYANSISQLITMFSWTMPVDRKRFKTLTKQGKMDPTIGQITEGINTSKGFKWLDPRQMTTHKGTELHHSHAWFELLHAARNILHRPHENTQGPREAVSKWQSKHYTLAILGEECQGKWERQKKGEPIIFKLNEEMALNSSYPQMPIETQT